MALKMSFDATRIPEFIAALPDRPDLVVGGCETHVCVLQTVLGLLRAGRRILLVRDAVGSRRAESKEAAIRRMERDGAEVVTTEMVLFEWLETAKDPRLSGVLNLVR
jgi:isochorismate hydrolase